jgi:8-oxo-dGTP pyrophosphatase MutT (NUDIX family)
VISPDAPVAELEPWIAQRLRPMADYDPQIGTVGSDYDLNHDLNHDFDLEAGRPARAPSPAAVLVGLVEREAGLSVLLTRRADTLTNHSGQVAFPGGRCDHGEQPWETALREAEEEIGLDRSFVRVVGLGDAYETVTGFRVIPVVGFVRLGFALTPSPAEVADVFEVPFAFLMNPANHERRVQEFQGRQRHYYAMPHEDRLIWGATAGMLRGLYERVFGAGG